MQTLMSVGAVSASTATDLFNDCLRKSGSTYRVDTDDLGDAVESLNNALRAYDFQVDGTVCSDGDMWWGFVNTACDDAANFACAFSSTELALFQAITNAIKTSGHGKIDIGAAINMVSLLAEGSRMAVMEGSKTIKKLVQLQWLTIDKDDDRNTQAVVFGPRSYLELPDVRSWARQRTNRLAGDIDEDEDERTQRRVFVPDEEEPLSTPRRRKRKNIETLDKESQPTSRRSTRSSQRSQSTQDSFS